MFHFRGNLKWLSEWNWQLNAKNWSIALAQEDVSREVLHIVSFTFSMYVPCHFLFTIFFFLQLPRKQNLPWLGSSKTTPTNWKIIAFTFHVPLLFLSKPRIKKLVKMYHNNQDQIDYHIHIYIHVPWYVAYWPDISGIKADTTWSRNSLLSRKT